jgi:hypothetical protein
VLGEIAAIEIDCECGCGRDFLGAEVFEFRDQRGREAILKATTG